MKNNFFKTVFCWFAVFLLLASTWTVLAEEGDQTVGEAQGFIDGIVAYKLNESGASSVQQWIDGALVENAGLTSEWYVVALSQSGSYDFSGYETALLQYLAEAPVHAASSRQKYALALIASGSTDAYIDRTLNDSIGQQGIMSWIHGLHLLNNGYSSDGHSVSAVKQMLLSLQLDDGGWAVMGSSGDVDVTAMAIQALAPHYPNDPSTKTAVDKALTLLSTRQQATGDYASYGIGNAESTAQVLVALSSLGIDCKTDSRFIKNGSTLFDGLCRYRSSDGSFCHEQGGGYNETATVQVFYSMVSYLRMKSNKPGIYVLDARDPTGLKIPDPATTAPAEVVSSTDRSLTTASLATTVSASGATSVQSSTAKVTDAAAPTESERVGEAVTGIRSETSETPSASTLVTTGNPIADAGAFEKSPDDAGYKPWVSLAIVLIAAGICVVLYASKRGERKNVVVVLLAAAVVICLVWTVDLQTTNSYYQNADSGKDSVIGTVALSIRCDTIAGKSDEEHIPSDGIILEVSEFEIQEGDTVYDILLEAAGKNRIHLETSGSAGSVYVEGIRNIYQFDFGDLSGWVYHVNGAAPSVGCGDYKLSDGDVIEWQYSCELGSDLM